MRFRIVLAVLLAFTAVTAAPLSAQERPSRADLGLYAGGAWTSPWLEAGDGTTFGIGFNPIFGGMAQYWVTRRLGVRVHGAYMPSGMPEPNPSGAIDTPAGSLDNFFYDLSLAFRPFAGAERGGPLRTLYMFVGGGGFTPRVRADYDPLLNCVPGYSVGGACLPLDWREATVGQGTAGAGITLLPITRTVGLFAEGGVHVYSSPFRIGENWVGFPSCPNPECRAEDRMAMTVRLGGGLAFALGVRPPAVPDVPPPPPVVERRPEEPIMICVVVDGIPQYVNAIVRPEERDTVVVTTAGIRRPLRAAYPAPPPTASGRDWFVRDEPIFFAGREYVRFGVPREVEAGQIRRLGEYQGVPLFVPPDAGEPPASLLVPVQDGCIFQPYQLRQRVERVRG
jgi:hypothetical protein